MTEDLLQWLIPVSAGAVSGVLVAIVSYVLGNKRVINDTKLERRTEIFEDMLRTISNLLDKHIIDKGIKKTIVDIKNIGISVMFKDIEEDGIVIIDEMKDDLQVTGMDEKQIDNFIKKYFLSLFMVMGSNVGGELIDDQIKLNEELMALGMYISPKMKKKNSYINLGKTAEEFNEYLDKFKKNKIDEVKLKDKASELSGCINEIMKFH